MNGSRLNWVKENFETAMCFILFLGLVFISVYFMRLEKRRTTLINAGATFAGISGSREVEFSSRQTNFMGLLTHKPISYYNLIVRRNPFASLPVFNPPVGPPIILAEELVLIGIPSLSEKGQWVAEMQNTRTGEIYSVSKGDEIAGIFKVKRIDREKVILSVEGKPDIILTSGVGPPPPPPPSSERIAFVLSGTIFLKEQGWIAQIENLRTGEIHFVREEEMIANIFNVKKIERNRVILGREGKKDIELKLGKR